MKKLIAILLGAIDVIDALAQKRRRSLMARRAVTLGAAAVLMAVAAAFGLASAFLAMSGPLGAPIAALLTGVICLAAGVAALLVGRALGRRK